MADTKLSALTELAAAPAVGDEMYIRDISEAASAESKRILMSSLRSGQTAVEAETDEVTFVSPNLIKNSPGVPKAWIRIPADGASIISSYNTASLTDTSAGTRTWVIATDFSADTWNPLGGTQIDSNTAHQVGSVVSIAVGSTVLSVRDTDANGLLDVVHGHAGFGDQ